MSALTICLSGLLFGALHVLSGPDHLAALAPFSVEARRRAWLLGLRWGIGHAGGIVCVGTLAYLVRERLDLALLQSVGTGAVGVILIGIGLWGLHHVRGADLDAGAADAGDRHVHTTAAFLIGSVHGVAGTGYLLGVLPLLALSSWLDASAYLAGFAMGTIAAMMLFSSLLGLLAQGAGSRAVLVYRRVFAATSALALAVGVAWILLPLVQS